MRRRRCPIGSSIGTSAPSTGSELRRPLGITIVGGLIVSQILTLFTTPVVYLFLDKLRLRIQGEPGGSFHPATGEV